MTVTALADSGPAAGIGATAATGIRIDRYMEVGFDGFASVVDAVGGVQICPKTAMRDPMAGLNVKSGCQQANSRTAAADQRLGRQAVAPARAGSVTRTVVTAVGGRVRRPRAERRSRASSTARV